MKAFDNKTTGIITPMELKLFRYRLMYWCVVAILVIMVMISILPALWILLSGFKDVNEIYKIPPDLLPKKIEFSKVLYVWNTYKLGRSYLSTFLISIGDVICSILFPALGGFVFSRLRPKGAGLVMTLLLWTMLMPVQVRTVPTFIVFNKLGLTNSYVPLWMMSAGNIFNIFLFKNYFDSISISYIEAARIDGCSDINTFLKIILPLAKPIIIFIAICSINGTWSSFLWPLLLLNNDKLMPVAVKLYKMKSVTRLDYYMIAIIFGMIPPVLMYAVFQRRILGGINIGGVKG